MRGREGGRDGEGWGGEGTNGEEIGGREGMGRGEEGRQGEWKRNFITVLHVYSPQFASRAKKVKNRPVVNEVHERTLGVWFENRNSNRKWWVWSLSHRCWWVRRHS